ncbi:MAG: M35 family metallo-endopeptidase [Kofleriaceae bacterium]
MSSVSIRLSYRWALSAVAAGALFAACADATPEDSVAPSPADEAPEAGPADLSITLTAPASVAAARDAVQVHVTIANVADHAVRFLRYQSPLDGLKEDLFTVSRDGAPVAYLGRHYKWAAPQPEDFVTLDRGQSVSATVDLATAYDFAATGAYSVRYGAPADGVANLTGGLTLQVEGRAFTIPGDGAALTTTGCSSTRVTQLTTAYASARTIASEAHSYLTTRTPSGTTRYVTWFGKFSTTNWSTLTSHFAAIRTGLNNEVADCTCTDSAYAYVFPTQPYKIYLCNAFWSAPNTGTDSRAGTLVHEMSHFNVVAATDDNAYGQTACKRLAQRNTRRALANADSHEYFAENTPSLP